MAASSGNGTDMGSLVAMLGDLIAGQRDVRATLGALRHRLDDVAGQVDSLHEAVTMYHSSVLGHGILISQLDARVRRIEHHLDLPPAA